MPITDPKKRKEAQQRADEKRKGQRHRGWVGILYEDSAPENWRELVTVGGVPCCVSPLHDSDLNADGQPKKPHRHVLAVWDGPVMYDTAKEFMDEIGAVMPPKNPKPGQTKPWAVTVRGASRYLCHTDNPDKAQYSPDDVLSFNGANYFEMANCPGDDDVALDEITDFIDAQGVTSFAAFVRYVKQERPDWKRLTYHKYAAFITRYIKAVAWEARDDLDERQRDLMEQERDLQERERHMLERLREKAQAEAGNEAMGMLEGYFKRMQG